MCFPGHSRTSPPKLKCADHEHANVAFAGLVHCCPQGLGKAKVETVEGWVGEHDVSHRAVSFKSDRRHVILLFMPASGRTLIVGFWDDRQQQMRWPLCVAV